MTKHYHLQIPSHLPRIPAMERQNPMTLSSMFNFEVEQVFPHFREHLSNNLMQWIRFSAISSLLSSLRYLNSHHAAGVSRRQLKNVTKLSKNVNILDFGDYIWNHHGKCIQMSTRMPGIGYLICEIDVTFQKFEKGTRLLLSKSNA